MAPILFCFKSKKRRVICWLIFTEISVQVVFSFGPYYLCMVMTNFALFLNDVSGSEILLILLVILIFFGSKSIPGIARTMGKAIYQIKSASQEVQDEIRKSGADIKKDFDLQKMVNDVKSDITTPFEEHARTLDQSMNFEAPKKFIQPEPPKPMDQPAESAAGANGDQQKS